MTSFAVEFKKVSKQYDHFKLADIDLTLPYGHVMGLIGPNGAGKSTTIRIMMGLIHQDSGQVNVLERPMPESQILAKKDIGFVSEDMQLYSHKTLQWHMDFIQSIYPSWDNTYAKHLLNSFEIRSEQRLKGFFTWATGKSSAAFSACKKAKAAHS